MPRFIVTNVVTSEVICGDMETAKTLVYLSLKEKSPFTTFVDHQHTTQVDE